MLLEDGRRMTVPLAEMECCEGERLRLPVPRARRSAAAEARSRCSRHVVGA